MTENNALFDLVQTLDAGEKRHFSLAVSRYSKKENNSLILFNALQQLPRYDEAALQRKLKNTRLLKNLAVEKHLLFERLVDSLVLYHRQQSDNGKLQQMLAAAEVLYSKAIYPACLKKLKAARALAAKREAFYSLLEIIHIERRLVNDGMIKKTLEELHTEEVFAVNALNETMQLRLLNNTFFQLWRTKLVRDKKQLKKMADVVAKVKVYDPDKLLSNSARVTFYGIMLRYTRAIGDNPQQLYYSLRSLQLLESQTETITENISGYVSRMVNTIISYGENNRYTDALLLLDKLKQLPEQYPQAVTPQQRVNIASTYFGLKLEMCYITADTSTGLAMVPAFEQWHSSEGKNLDRNHFMVICMVIANLHFLAGQYRKCLQWLRTVINENDVGYRDDIQAFARIVLLVTHYKMEHSDLLPALLRNTYRYLLKRENLFALEKELLQFIASRLRPDAHALNLHSAMEKLLLRLRVIVRDPVEAKTLDYFDLISWLESEISGKPFDEVKRGKHAAAG
jgi:hypothetical protein